MTVSGRLAGRRAVVAGAAGGVGRALALGVAAAGAEVVCADLDAPGADSTACLVRDSGGCAWHVKADLADIAAVEGLLAAACSRMGGADLLYANAGGSRGETVPFLEMTPQTWRAMFDRNLTTALNCGLVFARHMAANRGGAIVFTSSQLSEVTRPGLAHYASAKGALRQLVNSMAVDLAAHRIRVNAFGPGPTLTPGNREFFARPEVREANLRLLPLGRLGEPDEMVGAAVFLGSHEASYVTGATIMVDGGYTLL